jgi:CCR4-NOT transcription complex subunit 9
MSDIIGGSSLYGNSPRGGGMMSSNNSVGSASLSRPSSAIGGAAYNLQGQSTLSAAPGPASATGNPTISAPVQKGSGGMDELLPLVMQLTNPEQRENVLLELSKKRESFQDLAPILWHSVGTVSALLQEIASIYPLLWPPTLTAMASNRVCNALALLQCVASHPDTRGLFLAAHIPLYLYPFLNTQSKSRPFEYLRLTSLGVIGALVKMDDPEVINFLLQTEIIPLCLRIMESGSELSKTVATFIVQKVLLDEMGLQYVCATGERFYAVSAVLNNMIDHLTVNPSVRLLKHIVRCYLRLSDNPQARDALKECLPMTLRDETFANVLRDDLTVKKWLSQLLVVVGPPVEGRAGEQQQVGAGVLGSSGLVGGIGGISLQTGNSGL